MTTKALQNPFHLFPPAHQAMATDNGDQLKLELLAEENDAVTEVAGAEKLEIEPCACAVDSPLLEQKALDEDGIVNVAWNFMGSKAFLCAFKVVKYSFACGKIVENPELLTCLCA